MAVIDDKEAKALADILALVVDENENVASAALAKLRQRAHQDGVTGGALKNLFRAVAAQPAPAIPRPRPSTGNAERDLASARDTIGELTVRTMEMTQELSATRAQAAGLMADVIALRGVQAGREQALEQLGRGRTRAWLGGALIGGVLSALIATVAVQSFPRAPVAAAAVEHPAPLSPDPVPLTSTDTQIGPAAINMNWSNTTAGGTRWRVLPSSVASGYSLVIDLGGGQAATLGAPAGFMQTDETARNRSVEALRAQLPHPSGPPR